MKHAPCRRHVLNVNFPGRHWPLLSPPSYGCLANNRSFTADRCQPPPTAVGHASPPSNGCLANNRSFNRWPPPVAADRRRSLKSTIQRLSCQPPLLSPLAATSRRRPAVGRRQSPPPAAARPTDSPADGQAGRRLTNHRRANRRLADRRLAPDDVRRQPAEHRPEASQPLDERTA